MCVEELCGLFSPIVEWEPCTVCASTCMPYMDTLSHVGICIYTPRLPPHNRCTYNMYIRIQALTLVVCGITCSPLQGLIS